MEYVDFSSLEYNDAQRNIPRLFKILDSSEILVYRDHEEEKEKTMAYKENRVLRIFLDQETVNMMERKIDFGSSLMITNTSFIRITEVGMILRLCKKEIIEELVLTCDNIESENCLSYITNKEGRRENLDLKFDTIEKEVSEVLSEMCNDVSEGVLREQKNKNAIYILGKVRKFEFNLNIKNSFNRYTVNWLMCNLIGIIKEGTESIMESICINIQNSRQVHGDNELTSAQYSLRVLHFLSRCKQLKSIHYTYTQMAAACFTKKKAFLVENDLEMLEDLCVNVTGVYIIGNMPFFETFALKAPNLKKFKITAWLCDRQYNMGIYATIGYNPILFDIDRIDLEKYNPSDRYPFQDLFKSVNLEELAVTVSIGPRNQDAYDSFLNDVLKNRKLKSLVYRTANRGGYPLYHRTYIEQANDQIKIMATNRNLVKCIVYPYKQFEVNDEANRQRLNKLKIILYQRIFLNTYDNIPREANAMVVLAGSLDMKDKNTPVEILEHIYRFSRYEPGEELLTSEEEFDIWCEKTINDFLEKTKREAERMPDSKKIAYMIEFTKKIRKFYKAPLGTTYNGEFTKEGFETFCTDNKNKIIRKFKEKLSNLKIYKTDLEMDVNSMLLLRYLKWHIKKKGDEKIHVAPFEAIGSETRALFNEWVMNNNSVIQLEKKYKKPSEEDLRYLLICR